MRVNGSCIGNFDKAEPNHIPTRFFPLLAGAILVCCGEMADWWLLDALLCGNFFFHRLKSKAVSALRKPHQPSAMSIRSPPFKEGDKMGKPKDKSLSHEEIWDDSALVQSWDDAVEEYKVTIHIVHLT